DLVAERQGQVEPPLVPAPDEPAAPLLQHEVAQPLGGHRQWAAERVAVEVHEVGVRADEAVAVRRQRVRHEDWHHSPSRTTRAEASLSSSGPGPSGTSVTE